MTSNCDVAQLVIIDNSGTCDLTPHFVAVSRASLRGVELIGGIGDVSLLRYLHK